MRCVNLQGTPTSIPMILRFINYTFLFINLLSLITSFFPSLSASLVLMSEGEALQFSVILSKCRIKDFRK